MPARVNLARRFTDVWKTVVVRCEVLPVFEQPSPRAVEHLLDLLLRVQWIPDAVVIDDAGDVGPRRQHRLERPLDRLLERPPVDVVLHARREGHLLERARELPVLLRRILIADDLDVPRIAAAEAEIVRHPDVLDRHRIHAHQLRGDRVDRHLVGAGEHDVLDVRHHAARPRAIAGEGAVHDREHAAMDLLLDHQQIDERLVDHRMRPVPLLVEQAAERVLHRAGGGREHVRLHRRQVQDVLADEPLRDHEPVGVDVVQAEELVREIADRVADVDPRLVAFIEMDVAQAVRLHDRQLLVFGFAEVRVDDDGAVVAGVDQLRLVAVLLHRLDHAVELPRRGRRAGKEEMPRDVDLQRGIRVLGQDVLIAGQVHHGVRVRADRRRRRFQQCDLRSCQ